MPDKIETLDLVRRNNLTVRKTLKQLEVCESKPHGRRRMSFSVRVHMEKSVQEKCHQVLTLYKATSVLVAMQFQETIDIAITHTNFCV